MKTIYLLSNCHSSAPKCDTCCNGITVILDNDSTKEILQRHEAFLRLLAHDEELYEIHYWGLYPVTFYKLNESELPSESYASLNKTAFNALELPDPLDTDCPQIVFRKDGFMFTAVLPYARTQFNTVEFPYSILK